MNDWAWAAGLFEGEGSFGAYPHPRACLVMTDRDVVERFAAVVGVGKVTTPRRKNGSHLGRKQQFEWRAQSLEASQYVMARFWPHLGSRRREQFRAGMARYAAEVMPRSVFEHRREAS